LPNAFRDFWESSRKRPTIPCLTALVFVEYQTAQVYTLYMETNCTATATPAQTLIVVCAWCPDAAEQTAHATRQGAEVSHGLCPTCAAGLDAQIERLR
jgi:hypothetical protein